MRGEWPARGLGTAGGAAMVAWSGSVEGHRRRRQRQGLVVDGRSRRRGEGGLETRCGAGKQLAAAAEPPAAAKLVFLRRRYKISSRAGRDRVTECG
ncbi:hypothetical protein PR202_ga16931 [Eleusine coracana subsp. coracana]|uniref:Uncharacterized protein n=1 Tax=Eleusine coracana subsp. coracana TaxID=191504 RepID=A0AAV5CP68_ELECO|nr:hypothetical protein PR202_ga16931 [Eleusine coracana subsp. coracana]